MPEFPVTVAVGNGVPHDLAEALNEVTTDYAHRQVMQPEALRAALHALCLSHEDVRDARVDWDYRGTGIAVQVEISLKAMPPQEIEVNFTIPEPPPLADPHG